MDERSGGGGLYLSFYSSLCVLLSRVASDYSSGSAVCLGFLRPLRPLREIKIREFLFFTQRPQRAQRFTPFPFSRLRWRVANFVTTRVRREFIHPLPPAGYSPLSQVENGPLNPPAGGRSQPQPTCAHTILTVPLRQGGRGAKRRRGWMAFRFPFTLFPSAFSCRA